MIFALRFAAAELGGCAMAAGSVDQYAFVSDKVEATLDQMSSLMETIFRLDRRGYDTTDAKDRLDRLERELTAWKETRDAIEARV